MKLLNNISISKRLNFILGFVVAISILILGVFVYNMLKKQILENADYSGLQQVSDVGEVMRIVKINKYYNNSASFRTSIDFFTNDTEFSIDDEKQNILEVTNSITGETKSIMLPELYRNGNIISLDTVLVDRVFFVSYGHMRFYQRFDDGFVCTLTDIKDDAGNRMINTYLPNSHPVVKAIDTVAYIGGEHNPPNEIINGIDYMTAYLPVRINGVVQGMIGSYVEDIDMNFMTESINNKNFIGDGYCSIISKNGVYKVHPTKNGEDISNTELFIKIKELDKRVGKIEQKEDGNDMIYYIFYEPVSNYYVVVAAYRNVVIKAVKNTEIILTIALVLIIAIFILVNGFISRSITVPLSESVSFAKKVAEGNLDSVIDITQNDEVGQMAEALNVMVYKLREVVNNIVISSESIVSASGEINNTANELASGSSKQADSVEEVSATMEQMVKNIERRSDNANETRSISEKAFNEMKEMNDNAHKSLSAVKNIAKKTLIINDIAFQTNILALNAAVEAARAGEFGKGFAVVASEVRKLADESNRAGNDIKQNSNHSIDLAKITSENVTLLMNDFKKVIQLINEISFTGGEQLRGAEQINVAVQELNSIAQYNATSSEELASNSQELASQSIRLKELISYFKV